MSNHYKHEHKSRSMDMTAYGNVPMNRLEKGTVLFAQVPYRENPDLTKTRPTIVLRTHGKYADVLPMYSNGSATRVSLVYRDRRSFLETVPVTIHQYNFVNVDPEELSPEILESLGLDTIIAKMVE